MRENNSWNLMIAALFGLVLLWGGAAAAAGGGNRNGQSLRQVAGSMLKDIHRATWIAEGKSRHIVYIFFDPNCPYCHQLYENTRSWVKAGKVQLRWIPVGTLTATSPGKAAALLDAKDRLAAFYRNENGFDSSGGLGGIGESLGGTPKTEQALRANEALLARTRFNAVPTMLFRADNGAPVLVQGAPPADKLATLLDHVQ
jgi:thiol:disulfide interchange protein DsbG